MRLGLALLVVVVVCGSGCARRNCVPEPLTRSPHLVDACADPQAHAPVDFGLTREVEAEFRRRATSQHPPGARPYHFLALSGGGMYGSFGVGVLSGWSESGTRPQFDVVTGISTGALIATFAFLGPQYDGMLREEVVGIRRRDIIRLQLPPGIAIHDALFSSRRFADRIAQSITPDVLCEVAKAHAEGRRLYVGTTNLDTRRLTIWDMGAIASRGTPESAQLYRDVVLASCSVPGALPPIRIEVEVNGQKYEEMHVDGGVSDAILFRAFMVADLNRAAGVPGAFAPPGSTLYVINNGKLYTQRACVRPNLYSLLSATSNSILFGKTRDELYRIYMNCLETGVAFRVVSVPQALALRNEDALRLSRADQDRLYQTGHQLGQQAGGAGWRDLPPGTDPTEQALPRTGTRFIAPGE